MDKTRCARAPQLQSIADAASAYRLIYRRLDALLRGRAEVAELAVPACPAWTIRQTVAHLAGIAQDIVCLNMQGMGSDSWTLDQTSRLGEHSTDELLDLWGQMIDPVTARLTQAPQASASQLVFDTLTHEHDIRGALREPGDRTGDPTYEVALGFLTTMGDLINRHAELPALQLTTSTLRSVQLGDPDGACGQLALDISDFEALRALGGRRSVRQLLALPWQGDPTLLLPAFTNNGIRPPSDDLLE